MSALPGLRVVRSGIHGYGGVTTRTFARGEAVCFGDGVLYTEDVEFDDTYALVFATEDLGGPGIGPTELGELVFYDLVDQTRWFNHSCEPNSEIASAWDAATGQITPRWIATRDLAVGEELTYDYAFSAAVAEPCFCGASTCRGLIIDADPDELALLSAELRARLSPALAALLAPAAG